MIHTLEIVPRIRRTAAFRAGMGQLETGEVVTATITEQRGIHGNQLTMVRPGLSTCFMVGVYGIIVSLVRDWLGK